MENISLLIMKVFLGKLMKKFKVDLHSKNLSILEVRKTYIELLIKDDPYAIYYLSVFYFLEKENNLSELKSCYINSKNSVDEAFQIHILEMLTLKDTCLEFSNYIIEEIKKIRKNTDHDLTFFHSRFEIQDNEFNYLKGKEAKLIECLLRGEGDKYDLIESIYGQEVDFIRAEKSFKVLLSRVRKKIHCDLILNTDGQYQILH